MVYNLLFTETSLCDISYTSLLTLASFFWANPLCFATLVNCPHILQQSGLRKVDPLALIPVKHMAELHALPKSHAGKGEGKMK